MHFGIKWADVEAMPFGELVAYLDALEDMNRQAREAARRR